METKRTLYFWYMGKGNYSYLSFHNKQNMISFYLCNVQFKKLSPKANTCHSHIVIISAIYM